MIVLFSFLSPFFRIDIVFKSMEVEKYTIAKLGSEKVATETRRRRVVEEKRNSEKYVLIYY